MPRFARRAFAALSLAVVALAASPEASAASQMIAFTQGKIHVNAYLALTPGEGTHPAVIVIHEWWGLNDWVKDEASKLADQGYVTLAVDLYRGKVADTPELAHELMRGLPDDRAVRDLLAASSYLRAQKNVKPDKIGAIGWCFGGGMSNTLALNDPKLAAAVINYGHLATDKEALGKIHASVLGIFGGKDRGIPVDDVKKYEATLKELGKSVQVVIYPEAGHAFENPNNKAGYRADDAADAWKKTVEFLAAKLKK